MPGVLLAALAGCTPPVTPNLRFTGPLTPQSASATCQPSRAMLQIRNGTMQFVPDEGIWVVEGGAEADGGLLGTRAAAGADRKGYATRFDGHWTRGHATGIYRTPRCSFTFEGSPA